MARRSLPQRRAGESVVVTGAEEIDVALATFEKKLQRKWIRQAAREISKGVAWDAQAFVPVDTGALKRSIKVRALKRTRKGIIGSRVITGEGFFVGDQYYGGMVEYGTSKMRAQPFLRPAMRKNEHVAKRIFRDKIRLAIAEADKPEFDLSGKRRR